jgi:hypothetical protein
LQDREKAWRDLKWRGRKQLNLPPTGSVYEFVGGIYGNGREDDNRVTASISFLELPTFSGAGASEREAAQDSVQENSSVARVESDPESKGRQKLRTWTHAMGDVAIIDFTMDPSQDLLVLVALAPVEYVRFHPGYLRCGMNDRLFFSAPLAPSAFTIFTYGQYPPTRHIPRHLYLFCRA